MLIISQYQKSKFNTPNKKIPWTFYMSLSPNCSNNKFLLLKNTMKPGIIIAAHSCPFPITTGSQISNSLLDLSLEIMPTWNWKEKTIGLPKWITEHQFSN